MKNLVHLLVANLFIFTRALWPNAVFINRITQSPWVLMVAFTEKEERKSKCKNCQRVLECSTHLCVCLQKYSMPNIFITLKKRKYNFLSSVTLCSIRMWWRMEEIRQWLGIWGWGGRGDDAGIILTGLSLRVDKLCGDDGGQRRRLVGQSTRNTLSGDQ